jgi:hypothetical protein
VNSKLANVATGEKHRTYDKRIGGKCDTLIAHRENGTVMQRVEHFVSKLRQYHLLKELVAELAATSMGENYLLIVGNR